MPEKVEVRSRKGGGLGSQSADPGGLILGRLLLIIARRIIEGSTPFGLLVTASPSAHCGLPVDAVKAERLSVDFAPRVVNCHARSIGALAKVLCVSSPITCTE